MRRNWKGRKTKSMCLYVAPVSDVMYLKRMHYHRAELMLPASLVYILLGVISGEGTWYYTSLIQLFSWHKNFPCFVCKHNLKILCGLLGSVATLIRVMLELTADWKRSHGSLKGHAPLQEVSKRKSATKLAHLAVNPYFGCALFGCRLGRRL
jgi:hypothetical protein